VRNHSPNGATAVQRRRLVYCIFNALNLPDFKSYFDAKLLLIIRNIALREMYFVNVYVSYIWMQISVHQQECET